MAKIKGQSTKEKRIHFNLTKQQDLITRKNAAEAGLTLSDYLRQVAINGHVKPKWTEEEEQMVIRLTDRSSPALLHLFDGRPSFWRDAHDLGGAGRAR